jgi:hypothetical protein
MMQLVVPLAGPDFVRADGTVKACHLVDGEPLLLRAIQSRSWVGKLKDTTPIFVLRDDPVSRAFADTTLRDWFPSRKCVYLDGAARGAAMSMLAGLSVVSRWDVPVCLDLCDILFDCVEDPLQGFAKDEVGGVALTFESDNPVYSYLRRNEQGRICEAREKVVISREASAGVYFFRNLPTLVGAVAHSLEHAEQLAHRDNLFVCPLFNGVLANGQSVEGCRVSGVKDIKVEA